MVARRARRAARRARTSSGSGSASELEASLPRSTFRLWLEPLRVGLGAGLDPVPGRPASRSAPGSSAATRASCSRAVRDQAPSLTEIAFVDARAAGGRSATGARVAAARPGPHLRPLRDRARQPARPRRGARGRRAARRGLQPALPPRPARASARRICWARSASTCAATTPSSTSTTRPPSGSRPSSSPRCAATGRRRSRRAIASSTRC